MKTISTIAVISSVVLLSAGATAGVVSVSIPAASQNPLCRPSYDDIWAVPVPPLPFNSSSGIGIIMNPTWTSADDNQDFALHQNNDIQPSPLYIAPNVPDPATAIVTYTFDHAEVISGVEIVQHENGITAVEGFLGNSKNELVSLGKVFGPSGDITDGTRVVPSDGISQVFNFDNTYLSGIVLQVIIRKTSYPTAFATHRIYPLDARGMAIPFTSITCLVVRSNGLGLGTSMPSTSIVASVSNVAPSLKTPTLSANNAFQFAVPGTVGRQCVVQTTTNLSNWIALLTNTVPFTFTTNSAADAQRFFRAVYLP